MARRPTTPEPPEGLGEDAAARWRVIAPELARRGPIDRDLLATYCQVWARWRQAEAGIAKTGQLTKTPRGRVVASPLIGIANQTATRIRALETRLGLAASPPPEPPTSPKGKNSGAEGPHITRRELSERLDVHMMTVTKWERDGMPIAQRGERGRPSVYDETAVRAWIQARDAAVKAGKLVDVAQERAKKERAHRALAWQTFKSRAGDLVSRAEAERAWIAEVVAVKAHLRGWATTLADKVHRAATLEGLAGVERVLNQAVREVLRELSDGKHAAEGA